MEIGFFPNRDAEPCGFEMAHPIRTAAAVRILVDANISKVTFDHGPIPAINSPAMKMEFAAAPLIDFAKLKAGDKVNFTLSGSGGSYTVQSTTPCPGGLIGSQGIHAHRQAEVTENAPRNTRVGYARKDRSGRSRNLMMWLLSLEGGV
ncbi:copper-binding protein [Afipia carboxidovorans]|uniref:copper-binding protein n=1 Tax=Afipia carboxidovorans TaxID=40137 RepID=UPI0030CDAF53